MSFSSAVVKEESAVKEEEDEAEVNLLEDDLLIVVPFKRNKKEEDGGGPSRKTKSKPKSDERRRKNAEYQRARRQRLSMNPEEVAERKRKAAEAARRRRAALKVEKTPEELEEWKKKRAEQQRRRRQNLTPEGLEERRRLDAEKARLRRATMSEEMRAEKRRQHAERKRETTRKEREELEGWRKSRESGGDLEELHPLEEKRRRKCFQNFGKKATMTDEELRQKKMRAYLSNQAHYARRGRWRDRPEEEKEKHRQMLREWTRNLTGEKKERHKESVRRAVKKYHAKLKAEGKETRDHAKYFAERMAKLKETQPTKWAEMYEKHLKCQRERYAMETPEQRQRRQFKEKVNGARRRQKKRLEGEGVNKEEIERRDQELKVRMWKEFDPEGEVPPNKPGKRRAAVQVAAVVKEVKLFGSASYPVPCSTNEDSYPALPPQEDTSPGSPPSPQDPGSPMYDNDHFDSMESQLFGSDDNNEASSVGSLESSLPTAEVLSFPCSHCPFTFQSDPELRGHIRSLHSEKCWKCPKCQVVVLSPLELSQHYQSAHKKTEPQTPPPPGYRFLCMRCPPPTVSDSGQSIGTSSGFKTRGELLSHVKVSHPHHYWPCDRCHLLKYSEPALQLHLRICRQK